MDFAHSERGLSRSLAIYLLTDHQEKGRIMKLSRRSICHTAASELLATLALLPPHGAVALDFAEELAIYLEDFEGARA